MAYVEMKDLEGLVFTEVRQAEDEICFETASGDVYKMYHMQDCCESVTLEEVIGDLDDLVNTPIIEAREASNGTREDAELDILDGEEYVMHKLSTFVEPGSSAYADESETWTFYNFRTIKGSVTMRWYGTSNGYYSESVDIVKNQDY